MTRCSILGCTNEVQKGGICYRHGSKRKRCSHDGCTNKASLDSLMEKQRPKRSCAVSATSTSTRPSGATSMTNYEESDDDDDVVVTKKKSRATTASKTQWRKEDDDNASYNDDDEDLSSESVNDVIYLLDDISESLDVLDLFGDEEDSSDDEEKFDDNDDEVIVPLSSKCDFFLQLLSLYSDCI